MNRGESNWKGLLFFFVSAACESYTVAPPPLVAARSLFFLFFLAHESTTKSKLYTLIHRKEPLKEMPRRNRRTKRFAAGVAAVALLVSR